MHIAIATLHVRESAQAIPLAAGCLKANLPARLQQTTELFDFYPDQDDSDIIATLLQGQPQLAAFPLYVWNRRQVLRISAQLRRLKPDMILVAGGPEASADTKKVLAEGALTAVIRGEGEQAFNQFVARLTDNSDNTDISGLVLADDENHALPAAAVCPDLANLPSPWLTEALPLTPGGGILWEVARGCHFNCAFCYDAKGHQGVRPLPIERLRRELQLFVDKQVAQIWVLDSTFNAPPSRGKKLLKLLLDVAPQIHYHIEAKADLLDDEIIELLSQLSCSVQIGLQSARPEVLKPLQRNLDRKQLEKNLRKLSHAGVTFGLDLIYGLPGDNHAGFAGSLTFALHQQPNQIDIFPLSVLPGTELFQRQNSFNIQGAAHPPYLIKDNQSYSASDMQKSHLLAATTDIFYNRGRAVGFFLQLCDALKLTPVEFLNTFCDWLLRQQKMQTQQILAVENWHPEKILPLQVGFVKQKLNTGQLKKLIPLAEDLIHYHYHCAEILLADECRAGSKDPAKKNYMKTRWQLNPVVRLQSFHYAVEDLESWGGEPLSAIFRRLDQEPCEAVFLKNNDDIIIESLNEEFALMLTRAKAAKSGLQIMEGLERHSAMELLQFAVTQGILLPVT